MAGGIIRIPMVQKDDRLICYQNGGIYEMCGESARRIAKLDVPAWVKLAYRSRLAIRLLRCIPRAGCLSGGRLLIFAFRKTIYVVDTEEKRVKAGFPVREGFSNPLNIVPMEAGGEYIAVYGDYGANRERRHVFLYGITGDLQNKVLYRFPKNTIRHIHNVIPDPRGDAWFVFTGDTGKDSGIYRFSPGLGRCGAVALGRQEYRAVQGFLRGSSLLYATDAVMETNHVYELGWSEERPEWNCLGELNGSCIYGTEYKSRVFLSTCVEPDETARGRFRKYFTRRLGTGIKDRRVTLVEVCGKTVREIASFQKDGWPMNLFQYGTIVFPRMYGDNRFLYYMPIGVKAEDMKLKKLYLGGESGHE